jgi:hypothetical protein
MSIRSYLKEVQKKRRGDLSEDGLFYGQRESASTE